MTLKERNKENRLTLIGNKIDRYIDRCDQTGIDRLKRILKKRQKILGFPSEVEEHIQVDNN